MPDTQAPTIGRRVYFWPTARWQGDVIDYKQPCDAGVVYVHADGTVNLSATDHYGHQHAVCGVPFGDFDRAKIERETQMIEDARGYADWMPYQREQQAKDAASAS